MKNTVLTYSTSDAILLPLVKHVYERCDDII